MTYPRYQSHKIVEAFRIGRIEVHPQWGQQHVLHPANEELPPVTVTDEYLNKHNPQIGGYYVRYPDGYESWSPAKPFEEGYTEVVEGEEK